MPTEPLPGSLFLFTFKERFSLIVGAGDEMKSKYN